MVKRFLMTQVWVRQNYALSSVPISRENTPPPAPIVPPLTQLQPDGQRQINAETDIISQDFLLTNGMSRMLT
jgi:hypothetical protein